jgi:hypothetical protein
MQITKGVFGYLLGALFSLVFLFENKVSSKQNLKHCKQLTP